MPPKRSLEKSNDRDNKRRKPEKQRAAGRANVEKQEHEDEDTWEDVDEDDDGDKDSKDDSELASCSSDLEGIPDCTKKTCYCDEHERVTLCAFRRRKLDKALQVLDGVRPAPTLSFDLWLPGVDDDFGNNSTSEQGEYRLFIANSPTALFQDDTEGMIDRIVFTWVQRAGSAAMTEMVAELGEDEYGETQLHAYPFAAPKTASTRWICLKVGGIDDVDAPDGSCELAFVSSDIVRLRIVKRLAFCRGDPPADLPDLLEFVGIAEVECTGLSSPPASPRETSFEAKWW